MSVKADLYELLDIPRTANADDIRLAYKKLALVCLCQALPLVRVFAAADRGDRACPPFKLVHSCWATFLGTSVVFDAATVGYLCVLPNRFVLLQLHLVVLPRSVAVCGGRFVSPSSWAACVALPCFPCGRMTIFYSIMKVYFTSCGKQCFRSCHRLFRWCCKHFWDVFRCRSGIRTRMTTATSRSKCSKRSVTRTKVYCNGVPFGPGVKAHRDHGVVVSCSVE
jgi:hypothetical protein